MRIGKRLLLVALTVVGLAIGGGIGVIAFERPAVAGCPTSCP
jgi:hypothetical protein